MYIEVSVQRVIALTCPSPLPAVSRPLPHSTDMHGGLPSHYTRVLYAVGKFTSTAPMPPPPPFCYPDLDPNLYTAAATSPHADSATTKPARELAA